MTLRYDFDICSASVAGDDTADDTCALFRDPATAEALRTAPDYVRGVLGAAGFGLDLHDSGAGPGRYPARDEAARNLVIDRLSKALAAAGKAPPEVRHPGPGAFDLGAFLAALVRACPVEEGASTPGASSRAGRPIPTHRPAAPERADRRPSRILGALFRGEASFRRVLGALALSGFAIGWFIG